MSWYDEDHSLVFWTSQKEFFWYDDLAFVWIARAGRFGKKLSLMSPRVGTLVS